MLARRGQLVLRRRSDLRLGWRRGLRLGLGKPEANAAEGHADLDGTFAFNCTNASAAKFIDIDLFNAFKGPRQIEAQIASPQGQFKRTLKRPATRLTWSK